MRSLLNRAIQKIIDAEEVLAKKQRIEQEIPKRNRLELETKQHLDDFFPAQPIRIKLWFLWHVLTYIMFFSFAGGAQRSSRDSVLTLIAVGYLFFGWPLWLWAISYFERKATETERAQQDERRNRESALVRARAATQAATDQLSSLSKQSTTLIEQAKELIGHPFQ